ncbi:MAG TPA: AmmeMemoRadiSam system protein A [Deltaproteobacteria bacterium]|nr:AmmeMemoRadiSam system protein A [Deltaproteobacteria bacterium]HPP81808.1 AmmeMemoRadiSam system protein A [Deltaproteobacteria bacterium]
MGVRLTKEQLGTLLKVARQTIGEKLGVPAGPERAVEKAACDASLTEKAGTFVTLTEKGRLRGCIGTLEARESILEGIRRNAINAAFKDPRFPPLGKDELARVRIEVSVLTEPKPLPYKDPDDLVRKLRPGVDGVIIRKGWATATFLPQVWEQLEDPREFLSHLCLKAGLDAQAWERGGLEVETYQVQCLEEAEAHENE